MNDSSLRKCRKYHALLNQNNDNCLYFIYSNIKYKVQHVQCTHIEIKKKKELNRINNQNNNKGKEIRRFFFFYFIWL